MDRDAGRHRMASIAADSLATRLRRPNPVPRMPVRTDRQPPAPIPALCRGASPTAFPNRRPQQEQLHEASSLSPRALSSRTANRRRSLVSGRRHGEQVFDLIPNLFSLPPNVFTLLPNVFTFPDEVFTLS